MHKRAALHIFNKRFTFQYPAKFYTLILGYEIVEENFQEIFDLNYCFDLHTFESHEVCFTPNSSD